MGKFYCYADETGQETRGELFIVAVVITSKERNQVEEVCEDLEKKSRKGKVKWRWSDHDRRLDFIQQILQNPIMQDKLNFTIYHHKGTDYLWLTVKAIDESIFTRVQNQQYEATVFIDGLPQSKQKTVGAMLRQLGVRVRKVRGVRKEENTPLIRLADSLCGLVPAAHRGEEAAENLLEQGKEKGVFKEVTAK